MVRSTSHARRGRRPRGQGRPRGEQNAVGREAIIAATRELLKTTPPPQLTRNDIARFAGVDPSLIRYYFGNKDNLLLITAMEISRDRAQRSRADIAKAQTARDKFRAWISALIEVMADNPHFSQLILEQIHYGKTPAARAARRDLVAGTFKELRDIVAEGERNGEFREVEPRFLHLALLGMCQFFFSRRPLLEELLGEKISVDNMAAMSSAYVDFVSDILINGLGQAATDAPARGATTPARGAGVQRSDAVAASLEPTAKAAPASRHKLTIPSRRK